MTNHEKKIKKFVISQLLLFDHDHFPKFLLGISVNKM